MANLLDLASAAFKNRDKIATGVQAATQAVKSVPTAPVNRPAVPTNVAQKQEQLSAPKKEGIPGIFTHDDLLDTYTAKSQPDLIKKDIISREVVPQNLQIGHNLDLISKTYQSRQKAKEAIAVMKPQEKIKLVEETVVRKTEDLKRENEKNEKMALEADIDAIMRQEMGITSWQYNAPTVKMIYDKIGKEDKARIDKLIGDRVRGREWLQTADIGFMRGMEEAFGKDYVKELERKAAEKKIVSETGLGLAQGVLSGRTLGISDKLIELGGKVNTSIEGDNFGYSPSTYYQENKSLEAAATIARSASTLLGTFVGGYATYQQIAGAVQKSFAQIPGRLGETLSSTPVLSTYIFRNVGEEVVEASVRTATGQQYGPLDFLGGVMMGAAFEGVGNIAPKLLKSLGEDKFLKQAEGALVSAENAKGQQLTNEEAIAALLPLRVDGKNTFGDIFGRARMAYKTGGKDLQPGLTSPTPLPKELPTNYKTAEDYIKAVDVDNDLGRAYTRVYGERSNKFSGLKETSQRTGVGGIDGTGATGNIAKDSRPNIPAIKELPKTALETPSVKDFNKYKAEYPDLELKNADDMKLIRSKETGDIVGVQNRAGDKRMFEVEKKGVPTEEEIIAELDKGFEDVQKDLGVELPKDTKVGIVAVKNIADEVDNYIKKIDAKGGEKPISAGKDLFGKMMRSEYLRQFGDEGKTVHKKLHIADRTKDRWIGEMGENKLAKSLKKLSQSDMDEVTAAIKGEISPDGLKSEQAGELFRQWDVIRSDIAAKAKTFGLKITRPDGTMVDWMPRKNYLPKVIKEAELDKILKSKSGHIKLLERMVREGNFKTVEEADRVLSQYTASKRSGKFGPLERSRIEGLPEDLYETDLKKILPQYMEGSYTRLADAEQFGGQWEKLDSLMASYRKKGGDVEQFRTVFDAMAGLKRYDESFAEISKKFRSYQAVTKLSLSQITNLGDIVKPLTKFGLFDTVSQGLRLFTKEGKALVEGAGVTSKNIDAVMREAGETNFSAKFMRATGFQFTERSLRNITAVAGENHAKQLFKVLQQNPEKYSQKQWLNSKSWTRARLEEYGIDVDAALKRGSLNEDDLKNAAWESVAAFQPVGRQQIPYYWQGPGGKLLTQFKSFAYKQGKVVWKEVAEEAARGNPKPLMRFALYGLMIGEGLGDLKAYIRGREREGTGLKEAVASGDIASYFKPDNWNRIIDSYLNIGGIGLASDFISNVRYGGVLGSPVTSFAFGPTLSELDDFVAGLYSDATQEGEFIVGKPDTGKDVKQSQILKQATRKIPFVGPVLQQKLFPSKQTYKARTRSLPEDIFNLTQQDKESGSTMFKKAENSPTFTRNANAPTFTKSGTTTPTFTRNANAPTFTKRD